MRAKILPATLWDVDTLDCFMRSSDRDECRFNAQATGRIGPDWSIRGDLLTAMREGEVWSMWWGDDLMGMGGCQMQKGIGAIWFLGTDLADKHVVGMTRACRRFMQLVLQRHDGIIGNIVPKYLAQRVAWLQHLGFDTREGEAHSMLQGHVIFWTQAQSAPTTTQRPL